MKIWRDLAVGFGFSLLALFPVQAGMFDWLVGGEEERQVTDPEQAKWALFNAEPCCNSVSQLDFVPLSGSFNGDLYLDVDAQVFEFKSGKSFVLAYRLPQLTGPYTIEISSLLHQDVVFSPNVILLDADFKITRFFSSQQFEYIPQRLFDPDRLSLELALNGLAQGVEGAESYMVIFTTAKDLESSTQMTAAMRTFAKNQGRADPGIPDPIVPHSAVGKLTLIVRGGASGEQSGDAVDELFNEMFSNSVPSASATSSPEATVALPVPSQVPDKSPTTGLVNSSAKASVSMLKETEDLYNHLITQAVANKDIDKALKLVEEAERAGSGTARAVFIEQVKALN